MVFKIRIILCYLFCISLLFTSSVSGSTTCVETGESSNPFQGLFQNWENRQTSNKETTARVNKYINELIEFYPESDANDIRLFMRWYYFGSKDLNISLPSAAAESDPWAEAARIVRLFYSGKNSEARNSLRKLIRELPSGDLLRYELIKLEKGCYHKTSPEYKHYEQMLVDNIENTVISGKYINSPVYGWLYSSLSDNSHCGSRYWGRLEGRLKPHAEKIDPWFWEMIQGRAAIAWAWESRGDGWADSVSAEGGNGFHKNLDKARKHFYAAIELHPERINAHIQLITVEMGNGSLKEMIAVFKKLAWYDSTNEAAWNKVLWGLLPRWGGSLDLIQMLAIEALDCPRRDSKVQYCGYQALAHIAQYYGNYRWQQVYLDPAVIFRSEKVFREYEKSITTDSARKQFLKYKVLRHLALLQYAEALSAADERGGIDSFRDDQSWHWGFAPSSPVGTVFYDNIAMRLKVFTGKNGTTLQQAEKLFVSGNDDSRALKLLSEIIKNGELTPAEKDYLIDLYGRWRLNYSPEDFLGENGKYKSSYVVATQHSRSDIAEEMVNLGYNITANENFPGETIYNIAEEGENTEELKKLHAAGAKLTLPSPETGHTPIHVAARYGNTEMVKTLLELGVPVDLKDRNGHTALHIAATKKHSDIINLLFSYGADPNQGDNEEDFCLIYLPQVRAPENIYKLFLNHPQINVNKQNHAGISALHYMAKFNTPTTVFDLIFSKGGDINIRDNSGNTPLDMAEAGGHTELVQYLLAKGGKRNRQLPPIKKQDPPDADSNYTSIRYIGITLLPLLILLLIWQRLRSKKDNSQQSGESEEKNL